MSSYNFFNPITQPLPTTVTLQLSGSGCPSSFGTDAPGNYYYVSDLNIPVTSSDQLPTSTLIHFALRGADNIPTFTGQSGCIIQFFENGISSATSLATDVATGTTNQIYFVGYNTYGPVPHITSATMRSDNASSTLAKAGDEVDVDFAVDEAVQTPSVTIAGHAASVSTTTGNSFEASTTVSDTDMNGPVPFTIQVTSTLGDDSAPQSTTTDGTEVSADITPPTLTADSRTTNELTPLIGGSVSDAESGVASVSAVVNGTTYAASTTASTWSVQLPNLPEGSYPIAVTASDFAGNVATSSATLVIDRTPPVVTITSGPADGSLTNQTSATFAFTSDTEPTTCAMDGGSFVDCSSGTFATSSLSAGTHLFSVSASDAAGNTTTINRSWSVDTAAPILKEVAIATTTTDTTPTYVFSSSKAGTIAYGGSCTSTSTQAVVGDNTITFNQLAVGTYSDCTLQVVDAAGNMSNLLQVSTFTITTAVPNPPPTGDKDQCKDEGWRTFVNPKFKNQGDCVSHFVSHKYKGEHDDQDGSDGSSSH